MKQDTQQNETTSWKNRRGLQRKKLEATSNDAENRLYSYYSSFGKPHKKDCLDLKEL